MSAFEETPTATLLTYTVGRWPSCVGGWTGGGGEPGKAGWLITDCSSLMFVLATAERPPLIPPLLLLSSTKNVNVLALSREER